MLMGVALPISALITPIARMLRASNLPRHHCGLVVSYGLYNSVLRRWLVISHRFWLVVLRLRLLLVIGNRLRLVVLWLWLLLVVGNRLWLVVAVTHRVMVGCRFVVLLLAGKAGTDQTAGTGSNDSPVATTHRISDGSTGHSAYACA